MEKVETNQYSFSPLREFTYPFIEKKKYSKFRLNSILAIVGSSITAALSLLSPIAGLVIASLFFAVTTAFTATHIYAQLIHSDEDQNKRFKLLGADPYANLYKRKSPILNKTTLTHFLVGAVAFTLALCLYLFVPTPVFAMMATTAICGSLLPFYIKSFIALLHSSLPLYKLTLKYKLKLRVWMPEKQPDLTLITIARERYTHRVEGPDGKLCLVTK